MSRNVDGQIVSRNVDGRKTTKLADGTVVKKNFNIYYEIDGERRRLAPRCAPMSTTARRTIRGCCWSRRTMLRLWVPACRQLRKYLEALRRLRN